MNFAAAAWETSGLGPKSWSMETLTLSGRGCMAVALVFGFDGRQMAGFGKVVKRRQQRADLALCQVHAVVRAVGDARSKRVTLKRDRFPTLARRESFEPDL